MRHLKQVFFDDLADETNTYVQDGQLYIRSMRWSPEEVVRSLMEESAIEDLFDDWLLERKESRCARGRDILAAYSQVDRFASLKAIVDRGMVIPFVGAGLSIAAGYPGWTQFLRETRVGSGVTKAFLEAYLSKGEYEEAAQSLYDAMAGGFDEAVESTFGLSRPLAGAAVQLLPYVFKNAVVTTNFDDVVKRVYEGSDVEFDDTLMGSRMKELPRLLAAGKTAFVRVHGVASTTYDRVLTKSEYDAAYVDVQSARAAVHAVAIRTLLFMGCSLTVDRTVAALEALTAAKGHPNCARHYAFLEDPGSPSSRTKRSNQLATANIFPIWYPRGEHDESIEGLLMLLEPAST